MSNTDQNKIRCFGKEHKFQIEATFLEKNVPTVNIEMGTIVHSRNLVIQLSDKELFLLAAVFLGYLPTVEFLRPDKGVAITRQPHKHYIRGSEGNRIHNIAIDIGDSMRVSSLVLRQLQCQTELPGDLLLATIKGAAALYKIQQDNSMRGM